MDIIKFHCWLIAIIITATHASLNAYFSRYHAQQLYADNEKDRARELLGACVACDTTDWRSLCNLGTIAFNDQEYAEAIKHFDKALEINPHCNEARERREHAKKLLEQQEEQKRQEQEKKQQEQEQKEKRDQENKQNSQDDNNNETKNDNNQSSEDDKQNPAQKDQQTQQSKLDQQKQNTESDADAQQQQENQNAGANKEQQKAEQAEHNASNQTKQETSQNSDNQQPQHSNNPQKIKDGWDALKLTEREKEIVELVEDTDKAAQHYMMMGTRKARRHDSQKDW